MAVRSFEAQRPARMQVEYHLAKAQAAAATHGAGARTLLAPAIAGRLRTMRRIDAERPFEWLVGVMPEALAFRGEVKWTPKSRQKPGVFKLGT